MAFNAYNPYPNPPGDPASLAANYYGQSTPGAAYPGLLQALAQANDFTMEDLQVNRQGWMSPRQREGAKSSPIGCFCLSLITSGGAIVGGLGIIAGVFGPGALSWFIVLALVLAWLGLSALLTFMGIRGNRKQLGDGRLAFLDGFVERERHESSDGDGNRHTSYHYVVYQPQQYAVNQQRFSVNASAFHALVPGLRYRVYYLPNTNKLFSIEPLP